MLVLKNISNNVSLKTINRSKLFGKQEGKEEIMRRLAIFLVVVLDFMF